MDWFDNDIFKKLDINQPYFEQELGLDPKWVNYPLQSSEYRSLYDYFLQGSEIMHRCNSLGELELITFVKDIDPDVLAEAPLGIQIEEFKENRFVFHINIWDQEKLPLTLPFVFDLNDPIHRYELAALCEQNEIPLYFLKGSFNTLLVAFSRSLKFPERVRERLYNSVLSAYDPFQDEPSADSDHDLRIPASSIPTEDLIKSGLGYAFDLSHFSTYTKDAFVDYVFEIVQSVSLQLWNDKYKGVQKGPFYFWLSQEEGEQFILYITPFYNLRVSRNKRPFDPVYAHMYQQQGFIRSEQGNPILKNAIPIAQYANGDLVRIDLDRLFLETALAFQKINKEGNDSLYQDLLDEA